MRRFALLVAGLALLTGVAATVSGGGTQAEARWVIRDLGTLGRKDSVAAAINDRGQIVGSSTEQAFLWENGKMRMLGTLRGFAHSQAADINNRGQIVGSSFNFDYEMAMSRAFLWENGRMRTLASPERHASEASAVNGAGEVVGWDDETYASGAPAGRRHAVLWQKGRMRNLGTVGGDGNSEATGISGRKQIVGVSGELDELDELYSHVLWFVHSDFVSENGTMRSLDRLVDQENDGVSAINDKGQIVGARRGHATVWESGKPRDLATTRSHGEWSRAASINNRGQIVGWWCRNYNANTRAALWENGKRTLLPNLPRGSASGAMEINVKGQIVGWAETKDGDGHAVLWTLKR